MIGNIILGFCFSIVLCYVAVEDYRHRKIPRISYIIFLTLGAARLVNNGLTIPNITNALFGALIGGLPLIVALLIFKNVGGGDIKLVSTAGFFLWFSNSLAVLFISQLIFAVFSLVYIKVKKLDIKKTAMPYGPFYAAVGIAVFLLYCIF